MRIDIGRRRLLAGGLLAAAAAGAAKGSDGKVSKSAAGFRFDPKGSERCGACASFVAGGQPQGPGTCEVVEGAIPQNGWCALFSPRRR